MEIESGGISDVGQFREINEDYFYVDNTSGLFIVCDGVGGHAAGEVASHKAIEFTIEFLHEHWEEIENAGKNPVGYFKLTQLVERAIDQTCKKIKELADADPNLTGMATTLTMLLIVDGIALVGHVGDTRLYLKRDNEIFQLTTDHTLLNDVVTEFEGVDASQIQKFAHCLTRSVGCDSSVSVETLMFEAREDDLLLLCTDGLSNYFHNNSDVAALLEGNQVHKIADSLVKFANKSGGKDNITAVVIRIVDVDDFKINTHRIKMEFSQSPTITEQP